MHFEDHPSSGGLIAKVTLAIERLRGSNNVQNTTHLDLTLTETLSLIRRVKRILGIYDQRVDQFNEK